MMPVFASFSENNNVHFIRNIMGRNVEINLNNLDDSPYYDSDCIFEENMYEGSVEKFKSLLCDSKFYYDWCYVPQELLVEHENDPIPIILADSESNGSGEMCRPELEVRIDENDFDYAKLIELITKTTYSRDNNTRFEFSKAGDYGGDENEIYSIVDNRKLVINLEHIPIIKKRISDIKLYDQIKGNLNNLSIPNAQRSNTHSSEFYCNENVYGNFNLIMVYGFLIFE